MGCWGMGIAQSDEFCEFYDNFMELYDQGKELSEIPDLLLAEYRREFEPDDGVFHDAYFAIAKAQWMCGGVQPEILQKVEEIISSGANIEFYRELEATPSDLKKRRQALEKFLLQIKTPRPTVRKRRPPAKPRELPPMEPGDVFAYKTKSGTRIFIFLGNENLPIEWDAVPVCVLHNDYAKAPELSNLLDEPIGIVCYFEAKHFPGNSTLKHLGKIDLPEGFAIRWLVLPQYPLLDMLDYFWVNMSNVLPPDHPPVTFLQASGKNPFFYDFPEPLYTLRDLLYPADTKEDLS